MQQYLEDNVTNAVKCFEHIFFSHAMARFLDFYNFATIFEVEPCRNKKKKSSPLFIYFRMNVLATIFSILRPDRVWCAVLIIIPLI